MFCWGVDIEGCDAWKAELGSNAPFWDDRAPTVPQTGRDSTWTLLPVLFKKIIHRGLEVEANLCHKSKDIAPRKGSQTRAVQRGYVSFWTYRAMRSVWIQQLEFYLMKVSISRLVIPRSFSTFSLIFSE